MKNSYEYLFQKMSSIVNQSSRFDNVYGIIIPMAKNGTASFDQLVDIIQEYYKGLSSTTIDNFCDHMMYGLKGVNVTKNPSDDLEEFKEVDNLVFCFREINIERNTN